MNRHEIKTLNPLCPIPHFLSNQTGNQINSRNRKRINHKQFSARQSLFHITTKINRNIKPKKKKKNTKGLTTHRRRSGQPRHTPKHVEFREEMASTSLAILGSTETLARLESLTCERFKPIGETTVTGRSNPSMRRRNQNPRIRENPKISNRLDRSIERRKS